MILKGYSFIIDKNWLLSGDYFRKESTKMLKGCAKLQEIFHTAFLVGKYYLSETK